METLLTVAVLLLAYVAYKLRHIYQAILYVDLREQERAQVSENVLAQARTALEQIEGHTAYLQDYVWETQDQRLWRDMLHGEHSSHWDRTFLGRGKKYRLWMREYDYDEGWHRDMSDAARRAGEKRKQDLTTDPGASQAPSDGSA